MCTTDIFQNNSHQGDAVASKNRFLKKLQIWTWNMNESTFYIYSKLYIKRNILPLNHAVIAQSEPSFSEGCAISLVEPMFRSVYWQTE